MKIYNYVEGTRVNGPGFRFCIWVQGCARGCPGCFNREACKMDGGREMSVEEILQVIKQGEYEGVSVSGGEPFYQKDELELLLREIKKLGLDTLVFTGFTYEELQENYGSVLQVCDYLVDGPYVETIPSRCKYAGSGNQRFLALKEGKIEEDLTLSTEFTMDCEIIINPDGSIITTGFFDI